MGCDIHPVLQTKKDGEWKTVDLGMEPEGRWKQTIYDGRNYVLFGILAGVRNYEVTPIAEPKGLPDDFDTRHGGEDVGDHSFSWLTLQEIMNYDWNQTFVRHVGVGPVEYKEFKENGKPMSWFGSSGGKLVTNEEMDALIWASPDLAREGSWGGPHNVWTQIEWFETYREACDTFCTESIPKMIELADGDWESVRIVFGFDS